MTLLLDKYLFYRPTYRLLADWDTHGLDLSLGTVTDGLKHLVPLFEPVYQALVCRSQTQTLWHADETRWLVFASIEGKVGYRWYLWVFHSAEVVVFVLAAGRSHEVPEKHFGPVEGRGHPGGGPVQGVPGDRQGQERVDRGGVLLGAYHPNAIDNSDGGPTSPRVRRPSHHPAPMAPPGRGLKAPRRPGPAGSRAGSPASPPRL